MIDVPILIDASVALNLLATGVSTALVESLGVECFVSSAVHAETIYVRNEDPTQPPEPVSMDSWLGRGCVRVIEPENDLEQDLYVQFAVDLDDGEAMSLAICSARGFGLATDDRKARRIASQLSPSPVPLISTSEILHHWAAKASVGKDELRRVLSAVEQRARFLPPHDDPLRDWWLCNRKGNIT
jgi:predicted nucleic acid-binding protein